MSYIYMLYRACRATDSVPIPHKTAYKILFLPHIQVKVNCSLSGFRCCGCASYLLCLSLFSPGDQAAEMLKCQDYRTPHPLHNIRVYELGGVVLQYGSEQGRQITLLKILVQQRHRNVQVCRISGMFNKYFCAVIQQNTFNCIYNR